MLYYRNNLYGATVSGGSTSSLGEIYQLSTSGGIPTIIYSFASAGANGAYPRSSLAIDTAGQLYGTTSYYGSGSYTGKGNVFELTHASSWLYSNRHSFTGSSGDGATLWAGLTADASGNFYGTTTAGGQYGYGTIFKLTAGTGGSYTYSALYSFTGSTDGANPYVSLTYDKSSGNLFGTTLNGGANGKGVVFMLTP